VEDSEKELIRARTDIVEIVSRYTALKRSGSTYKGICPFHQEKTPSFYVDPNQGRWHCWGACSEGGDVFSFVMKAEGISFREAIESLADKAGVTLSRRGVSPEEAGRQRDERTRLLAANSEAARFYRAMLGRIPVAQAYVRKRGLAHETVEAFGIGFAPNDWSPLADHLQARGIAAEDAERVGLVFHNAHGYTDRFRGRLILPMFRSGSSPSAGG
jgi:DNA primase